MVHNLPKHVGNPAVGKVRSRGNGGATVFGGPGRMVHNLPTNKMYMENFDFASDGPSANGFIIGAPSASA